MKALLLVVLVGGSTSAVADPAVDRKVDHNTDRDVGRMVTDDCARARKAGKICVLDVGAEDVGGAAPTAGGTGVNVITFDPNRSLIRLRRDFLAELLKSAEDM